MNCRQFQMLLYDYLDETLASGKHASADQHLANCANCRNALHRERDLSTSLSRALRQESEPVALTTDIRNRILDLALHRPRSSPNLDLNRLRAVLDWLARPALTAACLLLAGLVVVALIRNRPLPNPSSGEAQPGQSAQVAIQLSYCTPVYTFKHEDGMVIDALECLPTIVDVTIWGGKAPEPATNQPQRTK